MFQLIRLSAPGNQSSPQPAEMWSQNPLSMDSIKETDYTKIPVGTVDDFGIVQLCPHCKKNGLAQESSGKMFYTHYQASGFENGQPVMRWDWCPKPTGRPITANPE